MNCPRSFWLLLPVVLLSTAAVRSKSPASVSERGSPGGEVVIRLAQPVDTYEEIRATVGGQPARVRVAGESVVAVRIPDLAPGSADVVVTSGRNRVARAKVDIRDTFARRVTLSTDGSNFRIVRVARTQDAFTTDVRSSAARLSFDLVSANGSVVHSGSIVSPTEVGGESFRFQEVPPRVDIGRAPPPSTASFSIRVPTPAKGAKLRVYAVAAGLDLSTEAGRKQRKLLQEVVLP